MRARDLMSSPVVTIRPDATLEDAARTMTEHRIGGLPVVDESGRVVGFITEGDFSAHERGVPFTIIRAPRLLGGWVGQEALERIFQEARATRVRDVMSVPPITASESDPLEKVILLLMERDINRVVIVRDGRPTGVIARHDLLRLLHSDGPDAAR